MHWLELASHSPTQHVAKDRTQMPPDTHRFSSFVVHLGNYGNSIEPGCRRSKQRAELLRSVAETYLVYGRGDLASNVNGNWQIPFIGQAINLRRGQTRLGRRLVLVSDQGGQHVRKIRVRMISATQLEIGFGYGLGVGWRMRRSMFHSSVKLPESGRSVRSFRWINWIPDKLAPETRHNSHPRCSCRSSYEYFVDYAVFHGDGRRP